MNKEYTARNIMMEDEHGKQTEEVLASSIEASGDDVKRVLEGQHSEWRFIRFQNGDLVLAVYPQAETYEEVSEGLVI